jgi:hypothetical protein
VWPVDGDVVTVFLARMAPQPGQALLCLQGALPSSITSGAKCRR